MSIQYIYEKGIERPMHIQRTNNAGQPTMTSVCGVEHEFNATINAPWSLGRGVCQECERQIK